MRRGTRGASAVLAAALLAALVPGVALADEAPPTDPDDVRLTVTLTDGVETVTDGTALDFVAEIRNDGAPVDAEVVLEAPEYVELGDGEDAEVDGSRAVWTLSLPEGTTALELPGTVGAIPDDQVRVTTLLSVRVGEETTPVVRTAVANRIDGVIDAPPQEAASASATPWIIGGSAVAILVLAGLAIILFRRHRQAV